jgi:hypothetical protein
VSGEGTKIPWELHHHEQVLKYAVEDCKEFGTVLDNVLQGGGSPLDLENDLNWLSRRICKKELFSNSATWLGWSLEPEHVRLLRALIWKMISTDVSRRRIQRAQYFVVRGNPED